MLEEIHLRERLLKHASITAEGESQTQAPFISEYLRELGVEGPIID